MIFMSVLVRLPGADTTTALRRASEAKMAATFLIWEASANDVPPNLHTTIATSIVNLPCPSPSREELASL